MPRSRSSSSPDFPDHDELTQLGIQILSLLAIWRGNASAQAYLDGGIATLGVKPRIAGNILSTIRQPLAHGALDDASATAVRERAFALTQRLLDEALRVFRAEIQGHDFSAATETETAHARSIVGIIDGVARELYFASGAHDHSEGRPSQIDEPRQRRFYIEAARLFDALMATGLAPATHSLVETLETMIPLAPEEVFLRIRDFIHEGHTAGYSYETQAMTLVVRIVERYLADYRHLFQANSVLRDALSDILNLFIEAGWPQALRLASRLEDIFR